MSAIFKLKKMLDKKRFIFLAVGATLLSGVFFLTSHQDKQEASLKVKSGKKEKLNVAACPSCYSLIKEKQAKLENYNIIKTQSTAESLSLLVSGKVDMIMAGRKLKPDEPTLDSQVIQSGYSLLSKPGLVISESELVDYEVFTDLDTEKIEAALAIDANKINKVDDVYKHADEGVIITSWQNTDYSKAEIVHLYQKNGQRVAQSREPALYCQKSCNTPEAEKIINILKNN